MRLSPFLARPMSHRGVLERGLWAWTILLVIALVAIDAVTPLRFSASVVCVALVLLGLWSARRRFTYFVAGAGTCSVVLGFFLSSSSDVALPEAVANHLLAVAVIWAAAFLSIVRQQKVTEEARRGFEYEKALQENEELCRMKAALQQKTQEVVSARDVAVYMLAKVAELRDEETGQHLERIRAYSQILALQLRKDPVFARFIDDEFLADLRNSSPLHDVGKVGIRDDILLKPGRFTAEEFEQMKRHTTIGTDVLKDAIGHKKNTEFLEMASLIARFHHERYDGTGYPTGLSGAAIPLAARIVAVADVYDALTSERSYKEAYTPETAKRMIEEEAGSHFDPTVVEAFRECFDEFVRVQLRYPNKYVKLFGVTESLLAEICD